MHSLARKEEYTVQETGNAGDISIHVPEGDGYDFVHPTILWEGRSENDVARVIEEIMRPV